MRLWDLDGGTGDRHRVLLDEWGELWGWENVTPRDKNTVKEALLASVSQWRHYTVKEI